MYVCVFVCAQEEQQSNSAAPAAVRVSPRKFSQRGQNDKSEERALNKFNLFAVMHFVILFSYYRAFQFIWF